MRAGLMLKSKPSAGRVYVDLGLAGREPHPSSDPTWDVMLTHRWKKKTKHSLIIHFFACIINAGILVCD